MARFLFGIFLLFLTIKVPVWFDIEMTMDNKCVLVLAAFASFVVTISGFDWTEEDEKDEDTK